MSAPTLRDLCRELSYEMGVARRSDLDPAAREHALTPGGNGQYDHTTLCGGGKATKQSAYRGTDCPRCLALLRQERAEGEPAGCDTCGEDVLDTSACPNLKTTCIDCCVQGAPDSGCDH